MNHAMQPLAHAPAQQALHIGEPNLAQPARPRSWAQRLGDLIVGTDPKTRMAAGLCFVVACIYMTWCAVIYFVALPGGLLPEWLAQVFMSQQILATLIFYPLVRSGLTRQWSDPGMVVVQILWTSLEATLSYALVPTTRPVILQTLCLIQVFGFVSLKPQAARWTGGLTITMLLGMLAIMSQRPSPDFDTLVASMQVSTSCFIIALLAWQSSNFGDFRQRVSANKRALRTALEEVKRITLQDALTGLPNRQYMQERIESERVRALRTGSHFSVALLDLDHFKQINDQHGHQVGDEVLNSFAQTARQALRETDLIGRWGGEEFVVLMLDTAPSPLGLTGLERVRTMLQDKVVSQQVPSLRVRFSAGITFSAAGETLEQLMARADKALYEAKSSGRDRTCLGEPAPTR